MGSPTEDLSDWVAVKANIFDKEEEICHDKFICGWNEEESKLAIILHEGSRKASDQNNKNKVCLLSLTDLFHIHKQLILINTSLDNDFPDFIKPNYTPSRKKYEHVSRCMEHYLSRAVEKVGKKLVVPLLFGDEDPLACYEENWNEFKRKNLENNVENAFKELEEILVLRTRSETLLQVISIYALEDQVCSNIFEYISELYEFHLRPFLELREMAHHRVNQAKAKLNEEIGPNIKKKAQSDFEEWNEQSLVATEAIQQLYQEFYRKTLNLFLGQRDRMLTDKNRFGKNAFELHAIPRLLKLEVLVCQEDVKLHNAIKATKEYQRDKIKHQLAYLSYDYGAVSEIKRIEEEIMNAQLGVMDAHMEVLEAEERLYKSQIAVLNKEYKDSIENGVFFDAVENPEDMPSENTDVPEKCPDIAKLKEKLNKIYRKRAFLRNKKKSVISGMQKKKATKAAEVEKNEKVSTYTRKRKDTKTKELPVDKLAEERKKTLQRLKEYKKKAEAMESKFQSIDESGMSTSFTMTTSPSSKDQDISTSIKKKDQRRPQKATTSIPTPPPLPPFPDSLPNIPPPPTTSVPPPPPPPPPPMIPPPPPPPPPPPLGNSLSKKPSESATAQTSKSSESTQISQSAISEQLKALKKTEVDDTKKKVVNPFSLNEILSIRSKLKAPPPEDPDAKGRGDSPMDLSSILQATMKRIRNITEDSDLESDSGSDFD